MSKATPSPCLTWDVAYKLLMDGDFTYHLLRLPPNIREKRVEFSATESVILSPKIQKALQGTEPLCCSTSKSLSLELEQNNWNFNTPFDIWHMCQKPIHLKTKQQLVHCIDSSRITPHVEFSFKRTGPNKSFVLCRTVFIVCCFKKTCCKYPTFFKVSSLTGRAKRMVLLKRRKNSKEHDIIEGSTFGITVGRACDTPAPHAGFTIDLGGNKGANELRTASIGDLYCPKFRLQSDCWEDNHDKKWKVVLAFCVEVLVNWP